MRRITYRPYILLSLFLFSLLNFPQPGVERLRSFTVACLSPSFEGLHLLGEGGRWLLSIFPSPSANSNQLPLQMERLQRENQILRSQIDGVQEWLRLEERIQSQLARLSALKESKEEEPYWKEFYQRRAQSLQTALQLQMQSVYARVIFREPSSWNSSLWINVGQKDNEKLGKTVIAKNSPVISGSSIVGIVEYVGRGQSRVRLISDARLNPSVRAARGSEQNRYLLEHLEALLLTLSARDDLFVSQEESSLLLHALHSLKTRIGSSLKDYYLAKGELQGCLDLQFRMRSKILRGLGFNYDFNDEEGPARDLRTGEVIGSTFQREGIPLLKPGDVLITTGLDGVFPAGFKVAVVRKINRLREGACSYELEAESTAGNLDELTHLFVLPPLNFEKLSS